MNRYWVGGSGTFDASTTTHWSATSGGTGGASAPGAGDTAIFDALSGGGTITVSSATCLNLVMTNFTGTLATGNSSITIATGGSITMGAGVTITTAGSGTFVLNNASITSNGCIFACAIAINGTNKTLNFLDDFVSTSSSGGIVITYDTNDGWVINSNNHNLKMVAFTPANNGSSWSTGTLNMGSGTWEITGTGNCWKTNGAFHTVNCGTSTIKFTNTSNSDVTPTFNVDGSSSLTFYNLWYARGASTGANDFFNQYVTSWFSIKDTGTMAHTDAFPPSRTTTIRDTVNPWLINGNSGQKISIRSAQASTSTHTISIASGDVYGSYLDIAHSVASGGARFFALQSTNSQATASAGSGWIFPTETTSSDTVSLSETQTYSWLANILDSVGLTDTLVARKVTNVVTNVAKHLSDFTNIPKS